MRVPARSRRLRGLAAVTLVAVVACFLAATGVFASCHESQEPMDCCTDAAGVPMAASVQAHSVAGHTSLPLSELPVPAMSAFVAPRFEQVVASRRDTYLRLSTLLI